MKPHALRLAGVSGSYPGKLRVAEGAADLPLPKAAHLPAHIKVGHAAKVVVKAGQYSNRLHIDVTLTRDQERRLLKMLEKRQK